MIDGTPSCVSWFVGAMFYISALYASLEYILQKVFQRTIVVQAVISLVFLWGGYLNTALPPRMLHILFGYIMFHIGVIISESEFHFRENASFIAIIAGAILYGCSWYKTISVAGNQIVSPEYYLGVSFVGFLFVSSIAYILEQYALGVLLDIIQQIGQTSMFILLIHKQLWGYILNPVISRLTGLSNDGVYSISCVFHWGLIYITLGVLMPILFYKKVYEP